MNLTLKMDGWMDGWMHDGWIMDEFNRTIKKIYFILNCFKLLAKR